VLTVGKQCCVLYLSSGAFEQVLVRFAGTVRRVVVVPVRTFLSGKPPTKLGRRLGPVRLRGTRLPVPLGYDWGVGGNRTEKVGAVILKGLIIFELVDDLSQIARPFLVAAVIVELRRKAQGTAHVQLKCTKHAEWFFGKVCLRKHF